jgi:LmbE family N-acetylglucosaminyl deacetylase
MAREASCPGRWLATMKLSRPGASIFFPDGKAPVPALARTTHLGIGAHQDDLEIMAYHGIARCFQDPVRWFAGVTCTDGAGSPRAGRYIDCSDEEMKRLRREEQERAASLGEYAAMAQLGFASGDIRTPGCGDLENDLVTLLQATSPTVVYTHNLADRHDTHVGVAVAVINAIRCLPAESRPTAVYGCEAWRGLDWMLSEDVTALDVAAHSELATRLVEAFETQIAGGKRYDLATLGRRQANATFGNSDRVDLSDRIWLAMDLSRLAADDSLDLGEHVEQLLDRFAEDVRTRLGRYWGASDA